jgi:zinc finger BED domain-containing protein 1 (E3 SUMO-protein ligase ZBED1)
LLHHHYQHHHHHHQYHNHHLIVVFSFSEISIPEQTKHFFGSKMSLSSNNTNVDQQNHDVPINEIDCHLDHSSTTVSENLEMLLFKPNKIRVPGYWEVISLIAPRVDPGKTWETKDATGAYCTKCKVKLNWSLTNHKTVHRHVAGCHASVLCKFRKNEADADGTPRLDDYFCKKMRTDLPPPSKSDQLKGEILIVKWIAESLRPFTLVADAGFHEYTDFLCNLHRQFSIPSRKKVRDQLVIFGKLVRQKMKQKISQEVTHFSATTDIWSSGTMESFMAITFHAISPNFEMINLTLAVEPLCGRHTGNLIRQKILECFDEYSLDYQNMTMIVRDNAANAVKACRDWGVKHFGCIRHTLHLMVGPLFVKKHDGTESSTDIDGSTLDEECLDDIVDYNELDLIDAGKDFDTQYANAVKHVSKVVANFRKLTTCIRRSVRAKEKLDSIQRANGSSNPLSLEMDVRTRWNSTLSMLKRLVRLKISLCIFLQYLKSSEGRGEMKMKNIPSFQEEDWALIECLCIVLNPFLRTTEKLSGEKYPTFVYALPVLCRLKQHLENSELLTNSCTDMDVVTFFENYGEENFFPSIISTVELIQMGLLRNFEQRFDGITSDVLWTTLLDPRCRSLKHLTNKEEKDAARRQLIDEVAMIALAKRSNVTVDTHSGGHDNDNHKADSMDDMFDIFDSPLSLFPQRTITNGPSKETEGDQQLLLLSATREVENYLDLEAIVVRPEVSSLIWWAERAHQFPRIAELARKWLCVTASSTPSERVFSDCGLALTAKRSRLKGEVLQDQVMIRRNTKCIQVTYNDIQTFYLTNIAGENYR